MGCHESPRQGALQSPHQLPMAVLLRGLQKALYKGLCHGLKGKYVMKILGILQKKKHPVIAQGFHKKNPCENLSVFMKTHVTTPILMKTFVKTLAFSQKPMKLQSLHEIPRENLKIYMKTLVKGLAFL